MRTIPLFLVVIILSIGTFWAFERGANDFSVFYSAWDLVLTGRGHEIYHATPDRFLYAPGFAWILSPIAWIPRKGALALWCLAKAGVVVYLIHECASHLREKTKSKAIGIASLAVVLTARPFLIDFQYGQVNTFILGAAVWAVLAHFKKDRASQWDGVRWATLSAVAFTKIFPLPLLLIPFVVTRGISPKKLKVERWAIISALIIMILLPAVTLGFGGAMHLLSDWKEALIARGLPMESHNQSFSAFLHHYMSGSPTPVLSEGGTSVFLGRKLFSLEGVHWLSLGWTFITTGLLLGFLLNFGSRSPWVWTACTVPWLIVPSHLVWKPYFILSFPLMVLVLDSFLSRPRDGSWFKALLLALIVFGINLTGFDFVGHYWSARLEAASLFLFMHLILWVWIWSLSAGELINISLHGKNSSV